MTEKDLRQDIVDELDFEPSVNAAHIGVSVDNGVVTLTGHVSTYAEKIAAERAVRRVRGVRAIAQEIEVRRSPDAGLPDEELARRGLNLLRWDSLLPRDGIQLTVRGGWITLTGSTPRICRTTGSGRAVFGAARSTTAGAGTVGASSTAERWARMSSPTHSAMPCWPLPSWSLHVTTPSEICWPRTTGFVPVAAAAVPPPASIAVASSGIKNRRRPTAANPSERR